MVCYTWYTYTNEIRADVAFAPGHPFVTFHQWRSLDRALRHVVLPFELSTRGIAVVLFRLVGLLLQQIQASTQDERKRKSFNDTKIPQDTVCVRTKCFNN